MVQPWGFKASHKINMYVKINFIEFHLQSDSEEMSQSFP